MAPLDRRVLQSARKRRPLEVIRERLDRDPEAVADYVENAIKQGRDVPRALVAILDRLYSDDVAHVEEPNTLDDVDKLTPAQARALWAQLQEHGRVDGWIATDVPEV